MSRPHVPFAPAPGSIADRFGADPARSRLPLLLAGLALAWGLVAAVVYWQQGLTLSHYDAKGHLVVARRVLDNLTPGWIQLGAVWLPLPHLLNLLPVQVDAWYRTGASAVAISLASFGLLVYCSARLVLRLTGARAGAIACALVIATNPNVLYLQATPMTEPLLLGLVALALVWLVEAIEDGSKPRALLGASGGLALAVMTRYEAWPVTAAAAAAVTLAAWRGGRGLARGVRDAALVVSVPVLSVAWFLVHSKVSTGAWFVTGGFYVPDPTYQHQPWAVTAAIWWGARSLGSTTLAVAAALAAVALPIWWWQRRLPASAMVGLAWLGVAALPWYAFFQGHPFRIRYMVPLVVGGAVVAGIGVGRLPRWKGLAAVALVAGTFVGARPFDPRAAMVLEAQWDRPRELARRAVSACLPAPGGGDIVMASMGSLAHYMQELSHRGFNLRDFLHEGNGPRWRAALESPAGRVSWILIEERAEGGDMLAQRARQSSAFLQGFTRLCEGGGVALYGVRSAR